jgi:hypothetical protein
LIYIVNPLGIANTKVSYCKFNQVNERQEKSFWQALKSAYNIYMFMAYGYNHYLINKKRNASMGLVSTSDFEIDSIATQ